MLFRRSTGDEWNLAWFDPNYLKQKGVDEFFLTVREIGITGFVDDSRYSQISQKMKEFGSLILENLEAEAGKPKFNGGQNAQDRVELHEGFNCNMCRTNTGRSVGICSAIVCLNLLSLAWMAAGPDYVKAVNGTEVLKKTPGCYVQDISKWSRISETYLRSYISFKTI